MTPTIPILYRDDALVVVDKPPGVAVHRGWAADGPFMVQLVRDTVGQHVYPVHRLDRPTSGALLMALNPETAAALQAALQHPGAFTKTYLAIVRGVPPESGTIDHPIANREKGGEARPAVTRYRRLWSWKGRYSLVEAIPVTGRLHQIRRHLKHLGHPLIGDVRYGKGEHNRFFRDTFALHRLALHASGLAFDHPHTGARLVISAPLEASMAAALAAMGLES